MQECTSIRIRANDAASRVYLNELVRLRGKLIEETSIALRQGGSASGMFERFDSLRAVYKTLENDALAQYERRLADVAAVARYPDEDGE